MAAILAIDTSADACSAALAVAGQVITRQVLAAREHTRWLLPMVDELLAESALHLTQLDALAFTNGPGSFTGLRIGMATIQGLACGADLPVLPLSTLQAMAAGAIRRQQLPVGGRALPVLDARMGELYWGLYWNRDSYPVELVPARLSRPAAVGVLPADALAADALAARGEPAAGDGAIALGLGEGWRWRAPGWPLPASVDASFVVLAEDLIGLAQTHYRQGRAQAVDAVEPIYLRSAVSWKKRVRVRRGAAGGDNQGAD